MLDISRSSPNKMPVNQIHVLGLQRNRYCSQDLPPAMATMIHDVSAPFARDDVGARQKHCGRSPLLASDTHTGEKLKSHGAGLPKFHWSMLAGLQAHTDNTVLLCVQSMSVCNCV